MNKAENLNVIDYLSGVDELMGSLWYKLQKLFPKLTLTEFGQYDTQARLSPDVYKLAIWRYGQLKLAEDVEQLTNLMTEPIADKLKRHPNLYRPQADGFNFDASVDRINRLKIMLSRCTVYTSDIDFFDESGVSVQVVGGIDELTYKLADLSALIVGLQPPAPAPPTSIPPPVTKDSTQDAPPPTTKRGQYKKSQSQIESTITYYQSEVRDAIAKSMRAGKEPDRKEIENPILKRIEVNRGYSPRTLRGHLPATKREELFGKIHRQILELMKLK